MRKIDEYMTSKIQEKTFFTFDVWNFFWTKKKFKADVANTFVL